MVKEIKKKLNIGLVIDSSLDLTDGVQQYVLILGQWLSRQGHNVSYLSGETSPNSHPDRTVHSLAKNITVAGNKNKISIPLYAGKKDVESVLSDGDYDILHVQMPHHPLMAGRLVRQANQDTAIVGTFHIAPGSTLINLGTKILGVVSRRQLKRFDSMISVSEAARSFMSASFGLDSVVVPNVVDLAAYEGVKDSDMFDRSKFNILFLGRLVERKGAQHLLSAINILNQTADISNFKVHICGDGHLRKSLQKYVSDNGLDELVEFHGFIAEDMKPSYLQSAQLAVFPATTGESFGIVLIEAMAANSPAVLAGANPGYSTVMEGSSRQLFDPVNHKELAKLILSYSKDKTLHSKATSWQQQRIGEFDVGSVGPVLVDLYRASLSTRRTA